MKEIDVVRKKAEQWDDVSEVIKRRQLVQDRLRDLCDKHGIKLVSVATCLTEGTLNQYIRVKTPPMINENTVIKAETILSK